MCQDHLYNHVTVITTLLPHTLQEYNHLLILIKVTKLTLFHSVENRHKIYILLIQNYYLLLHNTNNST